MINEKYPFKLPELGYPYNSLEPYIDSETMSYHHDKHFKTYVDNLNNILKNYPIYQNLTLKQILQNIASFPSEIQTNVRNNAGGVFNHWLYFKIINPFFVSKNKDNKLISKLSSTYGSMDNFFSEFKRKSKEVFGSGYTFLVLDKLNNLKLINTKNQDTPLEQNLKPILLIDLWEHAYYLKYRNLRDEYIDNFIRVINFDVANEVFLDFLKYN